MDEAENETAGRGMICNREVKEGDELFSLPTNLLLTKETAKAVRDHAPFRTRAVSPGLDVWGKDRRFLSLEALSV